jgi:hypothetical protein
VCEREREREREREEREERERERERSKCGDSNADIPGEISQVKCVSSVSAAVKQQ